jgi:hypothetical protein
MSLEKQERIKSGADCLIDDPLLMLHKKELTSNGSPCALINVIKSKHKEAGISELKESVVKVNGNPHFQVEISMPATGKRPSLSGKAVYSNKKTA